MMKKAVAFFLFFAMLTLSYTFKLQKRTEEQEEDDIGSIIGKNRSKNYQLATPRLSCLTSANSSCSDLPYFQNYTVKLILFLQLHDYSAVECHLCVIVLNVRTN